MFLSLKRVLPRRRSKCVRQTPVHSSRDAPVSRRQWARGSDEALPDERMMLCLELYSFNALFSFNCPNTWTRNTQKTFDSSVRQESEIFGEQRSNEENGFFRRASNDCPAAWRVCGPLPLSASFGGKPRWRVGGAFSSGRRSLTQQTSSHKCVLVYGINSRAE